MFDFTVRIDGGDKFTVTAETRDVVVWERSGREKTFAGLMNDLNMVDLYRLAHIASRRCGMFDGTLQEFETSCDLDFQETVEPDPTNGGRSTGPSSASLSPPVSRPASGPPRTTVQSSPQSN